MKVLFIIFIFLSCQSKIFAQEKVDYNESEKLIEKIISSSFKINDLDKEYNSLYIRTIKNFLSQEDKIDFRNKMKDLLNARN